MIERYIILFGLCYYLGRFCGVKFIRYKRIIIDLIMAKERKITELDGKITELDSKITELKDKDNFDISSNNPILSYAAINVVFPNYVQSPPIFPKFNTSDIFKPVDASLTIRLPDKQVENYIKQRGQDIVAVIQQQNLTEIEEIIKKEDIFISNTQEEKEEEFEIINS